MENRQQPQQNQQQQTNRQQSQQQQTNQQQIQQPQQSGPIVVKASKDKKKINQKVIIDRLCVTKLCNKNKKCSRLVIFRT